MNSVIKRVVVNELHKSARVNYPRRHVIVKNLKDLFQADLVSMIPYAKQNNGFKYILVVINVFSKFVWAYPIKNKTGVEVTNAMSQIFKNKKNIPKNLQTDMGTEFYNKPFKTLMSRYGINHYSTYSNLKASVVERVNRTLKNLMWKEFSQRGHYKWIDILNNIVRKYNTTKHKTINCRPIDVSKKNEKDILKTAYSHLKILRVPKFRIGDKVRVSKYRTVFDKGYTPNWSNEIFTVNKIQPTNPRTYILSDQTSQLIKGGFYEQELQKVKYPDVFLIEKILKKKGNKLRVKWLGLDNKHNSWIDEADLR